MYPARINDISVGGRNEVKCCAESIHLGWKQNFAEEIRREAKLNGYEYICNFK
jgi:hypothetical protein